jgi:hypothetical protein
MFVALLVAAVLGGLVLALLLRDPHRVFAFANRESRRRLRVIPSRCEDCRFWDLDAGQHMMKANPAFFAATAHLQPWQMGGMRKVEMNPDYLEIEAQLQEAIKAKDPEAQKELHEKLLSLDPGELVDPETYIDPETLKSSWMELGACSKHQELRMGRDSCPLAEAKR